MSKWSKIDFEDYHVSSHSMVYSQERLYLLFGEIGKIIDEFEDRTITNCMYTIDLIDGEENEFDPGHGPSARRDTLVAQNDNYIIIHGGSDSETQRMDTWLFNLKTQSWKPLRFPVASKLPESRRWQCVSLHKSFLYMCGGEDDTTQDRTKFDDLWRLDLTIPEWTDVKFEGFRPLPGRFCTLATVGDFLWRFGGRDDKVRFNNMYRYDILANEWDEPSTRGKIPLPRASHSCCVYDTSLFIFGGNSGKTNNELWEFNTVTLTWNELIVNGLAPITRALHAAAINTKSGEMYISGGYNEVEFRLDDIWKIQLPKPNSKNSIQLNLFARNFANFVDVEIY